MKLKLLVLCCCSFLTLPLLAEEKLVFALDLIRHGGRTPYLDVNNPSYQWPEGLGELTPLGLQQEYQLGLSKRKMYMNENHLLPTTYHADTMYVRSSDFDRTLMSAEAFLYGLYPLGSGPTLRHRPALPSRFQPIPVHTADLATDTLLGGVPTAKRLALAKRYVFTQKEWQAKEAALAPKFPTWSAAVGISITNLNQLIPVADALMIRQANGVSMPPNLSDEDVNTIIDSGSWAFLQEYKNPEIAHAAVHNLLLQLDQYLVDASQAKTSLKYVLWSAHDVTIMALLSDMGVPLSTPVPYAADVNVSLWQDRDGQYSVKMTYNDRPVRFSVCQDKDVCTLTQFLAIKD